MRQTTLCVPLEVKPESCGRLVALVEQLKTRAGGYEADNFHAVRDRIPVLHFMSLSVFPAQNYDPQFILEANFDGLPGPFWGQLEATFGEELRGIIRCCKKPLTENGDLYDAITRPGSRVPVAGYLEARTQQPSVFHHGNRGLTRDRILEDHALFLAVQDALDGSAVLVTGGHGAIHERLRPLMLKHFGWLGEPPPVRISTAERIADVARLLLFAVWTLILLSAPGLILALLFGEDRSYWIVLAIAAALVWRALYTRRKAIRGTEGVNRIGVPWFRLMLPLALGLIGYLVLALVVLAPLILAYHELSWRPDAPGMATGLHGALGIILGAVRVILLGLASAVLVMLPFLVLMLRLDEMEDSSQNDPPIDERVLRQMVRREDWITQNHMGSIVLVKPGILRSIIIHAGHRGLGLLLRVVARDGYLGSMRTVHFAHWAFLDNGSRLLFFSNFDHSWGSYLDDFIEKAHVGLTLAWGSGVGFPATRMLILDGASHGRQFKTWALASRTVSRFWYSAYPDLTVDQIERNHRIANGLRRPTLTDKEAEAWALDL